MKQGKLAEAQQELVLGIDLGTTNSLIAYIKDGKAITIKDESGKNALVPSIVHFKIEDGTTVVGEPAKHFLATAPERTIYSVKRLLGKSYNDLKNRTNYFGYKIIEEAGDSLVKIMIDDKFYTPTELSALILKELKKRAEAELNSPVKKVVITVPAYFNDAQRQATRDAGKLASFDVLRILNEPTAASLAYGINQKDGQTVAVYDLGGGTFDLSILQIQDGIFEVLATKGDTFLGGDDFDAAIVEHWAAQLPEQWHDDKHFAQSLRLMAERAKKQLSATEFFEEALEGHIFQLQRTVFEEITQHLVEKTLVNCREALVDAKLQISDIEHVVMVGGATRIPLVKQMVSNFFGKPVFDKLNPDEVVALGAAIQADVLAGNEKNVLLLDVTPLSLGIETAGGLMDTIIPRNSKIPNRAGRQYTTSLDGQKNLKIAIYQGERDLVSYNRKLGEFILKGIPPMPAGLPKIDIQFSLNADGILTVRARELRSNVEQVVEMRPSYALSEEEMAKMLLDSIQHAEDDMKQRGILEAINEGNNLTFATQRFLKQNDQKLDEQEKASIEILMNELQKAIQYKDKDLINKAMDALNTYAEPIAQRLMDETIRESMSGKSLSDIPK